MNTEAMTARTLKISVLIGIAVIIVGIVANLCGLGTDVLWFGLLLLIVSPLIGVAVTTVSLFLEKDTKWAFVAVLLIVISAIGMLIK